VLAAEAKQEQAPRQEQPRAAAADVSALSSMLASKWKGGGGGGAAADAGGEPASKRDSVKPGQIRSFRIAKLDPGKKRIDLELAG
jgi:hypothetical protein